MTCVSAMDNLKNRCKDMPIDGTSFTRALSRCEISDCRGICCYDGVYLDPAEEARLVALVDARCADFAALGANLPDQVVETGTIRDHEVGRKTVSRPLNANAAPTDFPADFERTECVFQLNNRHCALQALAIRDGLHPWTYKPLSCWLFPITIHFGKIELRGETDADYDHCVTNTRCGRTCTGGQPALGVLAEELRYLGEILGRDLVAEAESQL